MCPQRGYVLQYSTPEYKENGLVLHKENLNVNVQEIGFRIGSSHENLNVNVLERVKLLKQNDVS